MINKKLQHFITFDTLNARKQGAIELLPYKNYCKAQWLRFDSQGYPLWKMGYYNQTKDDVCIEMYPITADLTIGFGNYKNRPFKQWAFIPVGNDSYRILNKHNSMFLDARVDSVTGKEVLIQNQFRETNSHVVNEILSNKEN